MKKLINNSLLCVGLDSDFDLIPEEFLGSKTPQFDFNRYIIDQTHSHVCAYKPNLAFYEARGSQGWHELALTMDYLHQNHPDIFTIADAKRADIGNTNKGYINAIFDELNFDAITLHPYLGREALQPFLDRKDKISIILCHTSNPGAGELQDLEINGQALWEVVAEKVKQNWNKNNNCMLVVGATYPQEIARVRKIIGDMTLLIPGIGAQGGDLKAVMRVGLNRQNAGLIINSSRGIIFSANPGLEAKKLNDEIEKYRQENSKKQKSSKAV